MYCRKCENELKENEKYCSKCGSKIENDEIKKSNDFTVTTNTNENIKPLKIKLGTIAIIVVASSLLVLGGIVLINSSSSPISSSGPASTSQNDNYNNYPKEDDNELKGKTYVGKGDGITYYLTFISNTEYKYTAKDNSGILDDMIFWGKYTIEDDTLKTVTNINGVNSIERYTIVDANTIKSNGRNAVTYKLDND